MTEIDLLLKLLFFQNHLRRLRFCQHGIFNAYVKNGKYCVVNNTYEPQDTTVYTGDGSCFDLHLDTNEIKWYSIEG